MNNTVIGAGEPLPENPSIPGQDINPAPMPTPEPIGDDVSCVEVNEIDISAASVADIETGQMTLGNLRPIQGYVPADDLPWLKEWNTSGSTLLANKIAKDDNQLSISLMSRGVNLINPMALPPLRASDVSGSVLQSAAVEALYFSNNGPSIATPGSVKRAAVEQSISVIKSQIVNAFNRDIPFSSMTMAEQALALKSYECELLKLQNFLQAIDRLRGYANFQAKLRTPLSTNWRKGLFSTDMYTALVALYNSVADLPLYDLVSHDRMEKLGSVFAASKRMSSPGAVMVQDMLVAEDYYKDAVVLKGSGQYASQECKLASIVPNVAMTDVWTIICTGDAEALALVQLFTQAAQNIRTQYQMVITALEQMISKGALARHSFMEYIPAKPNSLGALEFGAKEPVFSYAFHERVEYQPLWIEEEHGTLGTSVKGFWKLFDLPDADKSSAPSACIGIRPYGLRAGRKAWKISEMIDVGLFREQGDLTDGKWAARIGASFLTLSGGSYTATFAALSVPGDQNILLDAVYGDFFSPGVSWQDSSSTSVKLDATKIVLLGMSCYAAGTGLHNQLDPPLGLAGPATLMACPALDAGVGGGRIYFNAVKASDDPEVRACARWFISQIKTTFDLCRLYVYAANGTGRQVTFGVDDGYKDTGYYTLSIAAVDNAVAAIYTSLIPFVRYEGRRGSK